MGIRVHLIDWKTGKVCFPIVSREGLFVCSPIGDNSAKNKIKVKTEDEVIGLIHKGYSVWCKVNGNPSKRRYNLFVDGKQVTFRNQKSA